jgi:5-methylcytosine-specific restriction protein A
MPTKPKTHDPLPAYLRAKMDKQRAVDQERRRKEYEANESRAADRRFYCSTRWKGFRDYLKSKAEYVFCIECKKEGSLVKATQLDHIKPRKQYPELAFDEENIQPLCRKHHAAKTNRGE